MFHHLHLFPLDPSFQGDLNLLPPLWRKKVSRLVIPQKRALRHHCYHQLQQLLLRYHPDPFRQLAYHGAVPHHPNLSLSWSHGEEMAALAISSSKIQLGVDIEKVDTRSDFPSIIERFFHPQECSEILAHPHPRKRFYRYWTLKESLSKAHQVGLEGDPSRWRVILANTPHQLSNSYYLWEPPAPKEHQLALAWQGPLLPWKQFLHR